MTTDHLSDADFLREHPYEDIPMTKSELSILKQKEKYRRAGKVVALAICLSVVFIATLAGVGFFRGSSDDGDHGTSIDTQIREMVLGCMDSKKDPCTDFVGYACGGWDSKTQIPPDDVKASRFYQGGEMEAANNQVLQVILNSEPQYLNQFYQSCLNQQESDKLGATPLFPYVELINTLSADPSLTTLMTIVGTLHTIEVPALFYLLVANDLLLPDIYLVQMVQAGLGLPDRDYYFSDDPNLLRTYTDHISAILSLTNPNITMNWTDAAAKVVAFEMELATISVSGQLGDYLKSNISYNKLNNSEFLDAFPMEWETYFAEIQLSSSLPINPVQVSFFNNLPVLVQTFLSSQPLTLQWYFQWQLAHTMSDYLSQDFIFETFKFYGTYLQGQLTPHTRADQCLEEINRNWILGMELGRYFIQKAYGGNSQQMVSSVFTSVLQGFIANLQALTWLDNETRETARQKALKMIEQSGYPGQSGFPDLSKLPPLSLYAHFANEIETTTFHFRSVIARAGTTVDPNHWDLISQMTIFPQTVTAFNAESPNIMFIPAGITQWPLFHTQFPPAMLYGGFAMVAGHELTHGFDYYGRTFDANGKLEDWWTPYTYSQFVNRSTCMVDQYSRYEVQPGLFLDGLMTVNENIADNGGLRESWTAYRNAVGGANGGGKPSIVPPFTNDQLFFLQFGQMWCFKMTPEYEQQWVKTNVHATPKFRVQGVLSNMQEFSDAFHCPPDSVYNPSTKCQVW